MTPHLPIVNAQQVVRVVLKLGFRLHRPKGSHAIYFRDRDHARVVIPMHSGKTIKPKTLLSMIDDMGITVDRFQELL